MQNNKEEPGCFAAFLSLILCIVMAVGLLLGYKVGYRDAAQIERDAAIKSAVGQYVFTDQNGSTKFVYGPTQELKAESTK